MQARSLSLVLVICCAPGFIVAQGVQKRSVARTPVAPADAATPSGLKTAGLNYSRDISRIYWGDFDHVHIDRSSVGLGVMMNIWMRTYGLACAKALPKNSVEIMNSRCNAEEWQIYVKTGIEVPGSRTCTDTEVYGSGIFADPDLYKAQHAQAAQLAAAMLGQLGSVLSKTGDAGVSGAMGMNIQNMDSFRQAKDLASDMKQLVADNGCETPAIKRYERNLTAYATSMSPVRMAGIPTETTAFRDSDYQTLMDDLVADQSQVWIMNHFQRDSIANVSVAARDAAGRPAAITARYAYQSMGKPAEGSVELRFHDGTPQCLVYADLPDACRLVSPKLVAAYEDGHYVTDHAAAARTYTAPDLRQVDVVVDQSEPVLVEVPGTALSARQGFVIPVRGKLLRDLHGVGPGGSVVLVPTGSLAMVSVYNTQRSTVFHLGRVGNDDSKAISFPGVEKDLIPGVDAMPRDGTPLTLSFAVPAGIRRKMLLTDFEKNKSSRPSGVIVAASPNPVASTIAAPQLQNRRMLLAGSMLQLQLPTAITVAEISPGKLFPATVVITRSTPITTVRGGETLPAGTTVYLRITQQGDRRYLIEGDHAVIQGVNVPLATSSQTRIAMPTAGRPTAVNVGPFRVPFSPQGNGGMVLLPVETPIHLIVRNNVPLDAGSR